MMPHPTTTAEWALTIGLPLLAIVTIVLVRRFSKRPPSKLDDTL